MWQDRSENMENKEYCERLALLRKACGYTKSELAETIGVSRFSYYKYESQGVIPRREVLNKLAEALDVTPKQLVMGSNTLP